MGRELGFFRGGFLGVQERYTKNIAEEIKQVSLSKCRKNKMWHCPFCPFRAFDREKRLQDHVRKYHVQRSQYVCSGTKQMKVICALFDHDQFSRKDAVDLLKRSAAILACQVVPALNNHHNDIDRYIRLVLTEQGPKYFNISSLQRAPLDFLADEENGGEDLGTATPKASPFQQEGETRHGESGSGAMEIGDGHGHVRSHEVPHHTGPQSLLHTRLR